MFMCDKREEYKLDRQVRILFVLSVFCCMYLCIIKALCVLLYVIVSKKSRRPSFESLECLRVYCVFVRLYVLCCVARLRRRQRNKLIASYDENLDTILPSRVFVALPFSCRPGSFRTTGGVLMHRRLCNCEFAALQTCCSFPTGPNLLGSEMKMHHASLSIWMRRWHQKPCGSSSDNKAWCRVRIKLARCTPFKGGS